MKTVTQKVTKKGRGIPRELIYEMRRGSPIYYRDYDKVLSGEKKPEEIMGSGLLHAIILELILELLFRELKPKGYHILTGEIGFKFAPKSWYNLNIAIYKKGDLKEITGEFVQTPPRVVIEIDTKADLRKFSTPMDYFHMKTQDLLDAGVEKVIWIFTKEKKIWNAQRGKDWIITDWDRDIEVTNGVKFNLSRLLEENSG